jgi:hypothetical protein
MPVNDYPRETNEPQQVVVLDGTTPVTVGVKIAMTDYHTRPTVWDDPVILDDGSMGVLVDGLSPGVWRVWAKVTGLVGDIEPVVDCGYFTVN